MKRFITDQKGSALLIALCLMLMLTAVGMMAIDTSTTDVELSFYKVHTEKAFYIAEAGGKRAIAELEVDSTWAVGYSDITFGGGSYSVQITNSSMNPALADSIVINSSGRAIDALASIEIMVTPEKIYPFRYAMFGKDTVSIRNSMTIDSYNSDSGSYLGTRTTTDGDLGSDNYIDVYNGAYVGGDIASALSGGTDVHPGATVTGTVSEDAPESNLDPIPQSDFDDAAAVNDNLTGISGDANYNSSTDAFTAAGSFTLTGGTYYFSSIVLRNSASLIIPPGDEVIIYVTGDTELKNSAEVNVGGLPSALQIYSQGDFVLKNSGDIYGTFYNPEGIADLRNSGEFYGSVVGYDVIAHNSAQFHYDRSLGDITRGYTGEMLLVAWREL